MRYQELVDLVRERGGFDSRDEAVGALRATLSTLGECLYRTERRHLASQLPQEAKGFLYEYVDSEATRREAGCFALEEFYNRVGARTDVTYTHAVQRAKAVVAVLKQILPEGEWQHIVAELPQEYRELFGEASPGPGSASAA